MREDCVAIHVHIVHGGAHRKQQSVLVGRVAVWPAQAFVGQAQGKVEETDSIERECWRIDGRCAGLHEKQSDVSAGRDRFHHFERCAKGWPADERRMGSDRYLSLQNYHDSIGGQWQCVIG